MTLGRFLGFFLPAEVKADLEPQIPPVLPPPTSAAFVPPKRVTPWPAQQTTATPWVAAAKRVEPKPQAGWRAQPGIATYPDTDPGAVVWFPEPAVEPTWIGVKPRGGDV